MIVLIAAAVLPAAFLLYQVYKMDTSYGVRSAASLPPWWRAC